MGWSIVISMNIDLLDPENIKKLFAELGVERSVRAVLAALTGKKQFVEQLTLECGLANDERKR